MGSHGAFFGSSPTDHLLTDSIKRASCLSFAFPLWNLTELDSEPGWRVHKWGCLPPLSLASLFFFLLFEGKIQALETERRQPLVLFLACCFFTVPVLWEEWEWGVLCGRQQVSGESYSHSSFPAVSNQGSHLFFKSSKLHTKLRQHGRMDFFAGKEAYRVIEKERSSLFFCLWKWERIEGRRQKDHWMACSCWPPSFEFPIK